MNEEKYRDALKDYIEEDGSLFCLGHYLSWDAGSKTITLDCKFDVEELEAIVWWMKNFKDNPKLNGEER